LYNGQFAIFPQKHGAEKSRLKQKSTPILLLALSARILAESAVRGGWYPVSIDLFADSDVQMLGDSIKVTATDLGFCKTALLAAIKQVCKDTPKPKLIYGGGVDGHPDIIECIREYTDVIGNTPDTLGIINSPKKFFRLLASLDIPHPETCIKKPASTSGWLLKCPRSEGGKGIYPAENVEKIRSDGYFQRQIYGHSLSALFLANGVEFRIIGFNTQWTRQLGKHAFCLSGIMNVTVLTDAQKEQVADHLEKLIKSAPLKGLGSIDFILEDGYCKVLEINPRPSASLALYDLDYPQGLLNAHVRAADGQPLDEVVMPKCVRAMETVYSHRVCVVPNRPGWPNWIKDRPWPESTVALDVPLCTITASGVTRSFVEKQLKNRKNKLRGWVDNWGIPGIASLPSAVSGPPEADKY